MGNSKEESYTILALQGIRGAAILLIMISHSNLIQNRDGANAGGWLGAMGVSFFIILSGYLAARNNWEKELGLSWIKGELGKKIRKFYPLHAATLCLSLPLNKALFTYGNRWKGITEFIINACLLQSWIPRRELYFSFNSVSWYLTLAVFFIAVTPLIIFILKKLCLTYIIMILITGFLSQFLLAFSVSGRTEAHWIVYICPIVRMFDFFAGGGLYCIEKRINRVKCRASLINIVTLVILGINVLAAVISLKGGHELFSAAAWTAPAMGLLLCMVLECPGNRVKKILFENRGIVFLGNISFELFLIHQLCIRYVLKISSMLGMEENRYMYTAALGAAVAISAVCHNGKIRFSSSENKFGEWRKRN